MSWPSKEAARLFTPGIFSFQVEDLRNESRGKSTSVSLNRSSYVTKNFKLFLRNVVPNLFNTTLKIVESSDCALQVAVIEMP